MKCIGYTGAYSSAHTRARVELPYRTAEEEHVVDAEVMAASNA